MSNKVEFPVLDLDYSGFPFANGLDHSCFIGYDLSGVCKVLTTEYLLKVDYVGIDSIVANHIFVAVPMKTSTIKCEWIWEVLKYHTSVGVQITLVRSDLSLPELLEHWHYCLIEEKHI